MRFIPSVTASLCVLISLSYAVLGLGDIESRATSVRIVRVSNLIYSIVCIVRPSSLASTFLSTLRPGGSDSEARLPTRRMS
jgi:hypothetical protein